MPDLAALSHEEDKEDSDLEDTPLDPSDGTNSRNPYLFFPPVLTTGTISQYMLII
jgi:hypothetical protein